ncbi:NADPH-dependent FMN reductase [Actinobacteria bacterium OK074]|nr:NADPH-dependent FMN reductase [Actinobacteria bacterium OK074]
MSGPPVRILGIGGSPRPHSTAERALRTVLAHAADLGADTALLAGPDLVMPLYDPGGGPLGARARRLVDEVAAADGLVLVSPAYHAGISGLVKNALDHVEELRGDARPYLSGRGVGCVAVGQGGTGSALTLSALRDVVHALRGWPTPLGVALNAQAAGFRPDGRCENPQTARQLRRLATELVGFARMYRGTDTPVKRERPPAPPSPLQPSGRKS